MLGGIVAPAEGGTWLRLVLRTLPRLLVILATCAATLAVLSAFAFGQELHFIDLGQNGAATLIGVDGVDGAKLFILVDTGLHSTSHDAKGAARVRDYLHQLGVLHLDLVVLSHIDADHASGLKTLLLDHPTARGPPISVGAVVEPQTPLTGSKVFYDELKEILAARGIPRVTPEAPEMRSRLKAHGIVIHAVTCSAGADTNSRSLVLAVQDRSKTMTHLLTGDLTAQSYRKLRDDLPQKTLVLQAPHHGGEPSLVDMLRVSAAQHVVIPVNRGNQYGHPRGDVLQRVAQVGFEGSTDIIGRSRTAIRWESATRRLVVSSGRLEPRFDLLPMTRLEASVVERDGQWDTARNRLEALLRRRGPARRAGEPIGRKDVLLTYDEGTIVFRDGVRTRNGPRSERDAVWRELAWIELRHLDADERSIRRTFDDLEAYCLLKARASLAAAREALKERPALVSDRTIRELWLAELEHAGMVVTGRRGLEVFTNPARLGDGVRATELAAVLVGPERLRALEADVASRSKMEALEALRYRASLEWIVTGPQTGRAAFESWHSQLRQRGESEQEALIQAIRDVRKLRAAYERLAVAKMGAVDPGTIRWMADEEKSLAIQGQSLGLSINVDDYQMRIPSAKAEEIRRAVEAERDRDKIVRDRVRDRPMRVK